ncbi:NifU family protein [Streptomyces sp. RKAG290]|uniref:NifU family protein n=1 Tax=Streptomyces sp. RKAG290 TaxID=2888348 RepID=UPI00203490BC|nr:NifU family protein [Streptomyces sp. RKAG290]MCM2411218.1 NifU family protein [Streptomyces sp. RKAG290]
MPDWRTTGERIDTLIAASGSGGAVARERSEELVRLVVDFYGAGLERLLGLVHEQGRLDDGVLAALAADDLVATVLLVHGLHPYGVETRVEQALESVRPYLGSHGGDVELLAVTDDGTVRLRLLGSCDGCPSSSVTLKLAVQGAVEAAAPEITSIEVETAADEDAGAAGPLVPVDSLFARLHTDAGAAEGDSASWEVVPELSGLESGAVARVDVGRMPVVACRVGGTSSPSRTGARAASGRSRVPRWRGDWAADQVTRSCGAPAAVRTTTCGGPASAWTGTACTWRRFRCSRTVRPSPCPSPWR